MANYKDYALPFFHIGKAKKYAFLCVPKALLTSEAYKTMSRDAKLLYAFVLDRLDLSFRNRWADNDGNAYIYYRIDEVQADLLVSKPTAIKIMTELEDYGLIVRKRQGQGKPTIIYPKDFEGILSTVESEPQEVKEFDLMDDMEMNFTSGSSKFLPEEVKNDNLSIKKNKTEKNKTENNNTPLTPQGDDDGLQTAEKKSDLIAERFNEFWALYPKKTGKGAAEKAFKKIKPDKQLFETMMSAVRTARASPQWRKENGQYIPNPSTWLNQKRWEDDYGLPDISSERSSKYDGYDDPMDLFRDVPRKAGVV